MRILVFSWRDPKHPLAGGAEQVMHEHMKGWIKAGHEVTLFSSKSPNLKKKELLNGVRIIRSGMQYIGVQIAAFIFYQKNKRSFDFVVDQFHGFPFFTPLYVRLPKIAVIQETAKNVWFLNPFIFPLNLVIGSVGFLLEPLIFLLYKNTKFATGSLSAKIEVAKMGTPLKNITIWPHGVIVPDIKYKASREKFKTITFLGRLDRDKGLMDAIKCFYILSRKDSNYKFWVIGKAQSESFSLKIRKLILKHGLESKIKFWGFVPQSTKFELLKRSHLLINPSVREGWGLVNIEANSMGVPVVAYKSAGLVDSVKKNYSGVFVKKNNPKDLAETVDSLLKSKTEYKKLSKTSKLWSKKFNWKSSTKTSLNLISDVMTMIKNPI